MLDGHIHHVISGTDLMNALSTYLSPHLRQSPTIINQNPNFPPHTDIHLKGDPLGTVHGQNWTSRLLVLVLLLLIKSLLRLIVHRIVGPDKPFVLNIQRNLIGTYFSCDHPRAHRDIGQ